MKKYILGVDTCDKNGAFGTKTEGLIVLKNFGITVPTFWAVDGKNFLRLVTDYDLTDPVEFFSRRDYDDSEMRKLDDIKAVTELQENLPRDCRYIVRSSSIPIGAIPNYASIISGAFESYECAVDGVKDAIFEVYKSLYSKRAFEQIKLTRVKPCIKGMAVLIQKFIEPQCSGVAHALRGESKIELNWVKGHLRAIVSGAVSGNHDVLTREDGDVCIEGKESHIYSILENGYSNCFASLYDAVWRISDALKKDIEVEWLYANGKVYIVQCQEFIKL